MIAAVAEIMDRLADDFFARAVLAQNQNGQFRSGHAPDRRTQGFDHGALAHQLHALGCLFA